MSGAVTSQAVQEWLLVQGVGAALLAVVAAGCDLAFGARRPRLVALLWWAVLVRLVVPGSVAPPAGLVLVPTPTAAGSAAVDPSGPSLAALVVPWLTGVVLCAAWFSVRLVREARHWRRVERGAPSPAARRALERAARALGLRRPPRLVAVVEAGPATVGLLSPWVALPADLDRDPGRREAVLLHELAHVRRRDGWRRLAALAVACAFWFHPAAWVARARLAALAEHDCDRRAADALAGGASAYRSALLAELSERFAPWPRREPLAPAFARPRALVLARLGALEPRRTAGVARLQPALALLALGAALAAVAPPERAPALAPATPAALAARVLSEERPAGCLTTRYLVLAQLAGAGAAVPPVSPVVPPTPSVTDPDR